MSFWQASPYQASCVPFSKVGLYIHASRGTVINPCSCRTVLANVRISDNGWPQLICASTRLEINWAGSLSSSTKGYPSRSENHVVGMLKTDPFRSNSMALFHKTLFWWEKKVWKIHMTCSPTIRMPFGKLPNTTFASWNQSHLGQHSTWHSWQQLQRHSECFWEHARPP